MQRHDFTLDEATILLLEQIAERHYQGNHSLTVREALICLAARLGERDTRTSGVRPGRSDADPPERKGA